MKVFVTGASGYLGTAVLRELSARGHRAVGLARSHKPGQFTGPGVEWHWGNLREPETYRTVAAACDAAVHMGVEYGPEVSTVDLLGVRTVLSALADGHPRLFLYTSGVWVLGPTGETPVDETVPPRHPAPAVAWRPLHERTVLDAGVAPLVTAVIRPGMVFGGRGGLFEPFFAQAESEGAPVVIGDGHNRWPTVHLGDVAAFYVRALEQGHLLRALPAHERLFHCVSGASERTAEIARAAARAVGREGQVKFWPVEEARASMGPVADALALDQVVISRRAERLLGFRPRYEAFIPHAAEIAAERKRG